MNSNTMTLRLAVFPRPRALTDVLLVVGGALLIAGCAQVSFRIPGTPVPVTGQTFAVLLVGAAYGAWRAAATTGLYLVLGLFLPFYAEGSKGWDVIVGASGGYVIGFVLASAVVGYLAQRGWDKRMGSSIGAMLTGSVIIYAIGLPWLATHAGPDTLSFEKTMQYGLYPFIPGDTVKLYLAAASLPLAWKLLRRTRGE